MFLNLYYTKGEGETYSCVPSVIYEGTGNTGSFKKEEEKKKKKTQSEINLKKKIPTIILKQRMRILIDTVVSYQ